MLHTRKTVDDTMDLLMISCVLGTAGQQKDDGSGFTEIAQRWQVRVREDFLVREIRQYSCSILRWILSSLSKKQSSGQCAKLGTYISAVT